MPYLIFELADGDVRGQEGFFHYRQYSAVDLAERRSLEDVWYLMFYGELPDAAASVAFAAAISSSSTARLRAISRRRISSSSAIRSSVTTRSCAMRARSVVSRAVISASQPVQLSSVVAPQHQRFAVRRAA